MKIFKALTLCFLGTITLTVSAADCSEIRDDKERLLCYDGKNPDQPRKLSPEELREEFGVARAIDRHLLSSLRDPDSLKDYAVSGAFDCSLIASTLTGDCACWRGNAKNSYGAYAGIKENAVVLMGSFKGEPKEMWIVISDWGQSVACISASYEERDPAMIRKKFPK